MQCPKCSSENPSNAQSCVSCGHVLALDAHGAVGFPNRPAAYGQQAVAVPSPHSLQQYQDNARTVYQEQESNSSGMGAESAIPDGVKGWTFAGMAPFGLFALYNGMWGWGITGLLLTAVAFPFYIVYVLVIGIMGREEAWRNRRFGGMAEFERTMNIWSYAGIILGVIMLGVFVYWIYLMFQFALAVPVSDPCGPGAYT